MRQGNFAGALLAGILILFAPMTAGAQDSPFTPAIEAIQSDDGSHGAVQATIEVPAGHYLYRSKVEVFLVDTLDLILDDVSLPRGKVKFDPFLEEKTEVYEHAPTIAVQVSVREGRSLPDSARIWLLFQGCTSEFCYFPEEIRLTADWNRGDPALVVASIAGKEPGGTEDAAPEEQAEVKVGGSSKFDVASQIESKGLFLTYLAVFLAGILLSFTPCVFPMIPITLSVIGARGEKNPVKGFGLSLIYVFGMAMTYAVLGVVAASSGALFGSLFQSVWFVLGMVTVFTALALGMFGLYELQVPPALASRLQSVGGGGGWVGIFLMGIVAGLVASPCVGPVLVGLLVYIAQTGSAILGFTLLFTLAMGIGVLFLVIGTFSGLLTTLPGAGTWMEEVKQFFGWLLLGVALYFAAPILPEKVMIPASGFLMLLMGTTSLGLFDPLKPGARVAHRIKKAIALLITAAGLVLLIGSLALPLLPLPMMGTVSGSAATESIVWVEDYEEGISRAEAEGLPVMIDFTADWCAACQELEHLTYSAPAVVAESKRFVSIQVDATRSTDRIKVLKDRYGVFGLPTIIWVDSDGEIQNELTVTGFVEADDYLDIMKAVQ